jgi:hypothetical protein
MYFWENSLKHIKDNLELQCPQLEVLNCDMHLEKKGNKHLKNNNIFVIVMQSLLND